MVKFGIGAIAALPIAAAIGVALGTERAIAQEFNGCYMVDSSGRRIDLNELCRKNPPVAKPKPKPAPKAITKPARPQPVAAVRPVFPPSANLQAFLQVIRYAEGTDSSDGYQIQYTGRRFYSFADHPRQVICGSIRGSRVCSTAAGAYQFLETTWDSVADAIGAPDFSPYWQDMGAVELIRRAGALEDVYAGRIETAIAKVAPVWASFPRWRGDSYGSYGQSVVSMDTLLDVFYQYQGSPTLQAQTPGYIRIVRN